MRVNLFGPAPQQLQLPTACRAQRPEPGSGIPIRDGASFPLALGLCLLCHRGCCFPHVRLQDSAKARSPASPSPHVRVPRPPGRGPGVAASRAWEGKAWTTARLPPGHPQPLPSAPMDSSLQKLRSCWLLSPCRHSEAVQVTPCW